MLCSPCPSLFPSYSSLHRPRLTCNDLFHAFLIFILPSLPPSLPFSPSFFNACDVCIGLLWCDQSSTPKCNCKIKTPAHTKTLHHDWLLPGDDLALCSSPGLPCPDWWLLPRAFSVIGCAVGERCSSPQFGLLADRYHFCEKCFNEIQGECVSLGDDPSQPQTWVPASPPLLNPPPC